MISKNTGGNQVGSWQLFLMNNNTVRFEIKGYSSNPSGSSSELRLILIPTCSVNQWSHIVVGNVYNNYSPSQFQGGKNRISRIWINGEWQGDSMSDAFNPSRISPSNYKFGTHTIIQVGYWTNTNSGSGLVLF